MGGDKLVEYWDKMAKWIVPFLEARKVAVECKFGRAGIYIRHEKGNEDGWFYISSEADVKEWADRHAWSFHPHVLGEKDWWFVADIDGRIKPKNLPLTAKVAYEFANVLEAHSLKYLVKFSGNRGFHFLWKWDMARTKITEAKRWELEQAVLVNLQEELEQHLRKDTGLSKELSKKIEPHCPFTITNSQSPKCIRSILIDANILHENSNIRAPFSVHLKTGLVSVPLKSKDEILTFKIDQAEQEAVVKRDWSWVKMPENQWA